MANLIHTQRFTQLLNVSHLLICYTFQIFSFSFLFNQVIPSFYLILSFLKSSDFDELRIQCLFTENYLIILENDYRHVAPGRRGDLPSPSPRTFCLSKHIS